MTDEPRSRDRPAVRVGGAAGAGVVFLAAGALGLVGTPWLLELSGRVRDRALGFTAASVVLGCVLLAVGLRRR